MAELLSDRAQAMLRCTPAIGNSFLQVASNRFHPDLNPTGIVDMGLAENKMCTDLWAEKLSSISNNPEDVSLMYYGKKSGDENFKKSLKPFLERKFQFREHMELKNLFVTNGVTVILEALTFAMAEAGDYIMVPTPYYYRIKNDLYERAGVHVLEFPLTRRRDDPNGGLHPDPDVMEEHFQQAISQGKHVRAVLIVNPNNPTGDVFTSSDLTAVLNFAHIHNLHVVSNEIYGLSVFDPEVTFTSIMALPHPDPERVHFTWGFSKDFGLSGYRCGVLYTQNTSLSQFILITGNFIMAAGLIQHRLKSIVDDADFIDKIYFPTMKTRMLKRMKSTRQTLKEVGVHLHPYQATFFLWFNVAEFLPEVTFEGESWFFEKLLQAGVFIVSGRDFYTPEPGWFRLVCALEEKVHEEGMKRLVSVLNEIKQDGCKNFLKAV